MFIAVLDLHTTAPNRPAVLAQLDTEREAIRAMPGNLDYRVYAARDNQESVALIHEWTDQASFAAYLASDSFARSSVVIRPLMSGPSVSRRFHASLLETV